MGLFDFILGSDRSSADYYNGNKWQADVGNEPAYAGAGAYNKYTGGALGADYESTVRQMLSGQPSQADEQNLFNRFNKMLGVTKGTNYGAPGSARASAEGNLAKETALQGMLLGQNQRQAGLSASMPFMNMLAGENQFDWNAKSTEANRQNSFNVGNYQYKGTMLGGLNERATNSANDYNTKKGGIVSNLVSSAVNWALPGVSSFVGNMLGGSNSGYGAGATPGNQGGRILKTAGTQ